MSAKKNTKELNSCPNTYFLIPWQLEVVTFEILNCVISVLSNCLSLICQRFTASGCKDKGIRKFEFVA